MTFRDTHFTVTLRSEDVKSYYTTRVLELQNISVGPIPPREGGRITSNVPTVPF